MRIVYILLSFLLSTDVLAARSIFQDDQGHGLSNQTLRQGNISMQQIPGVIVAITNNLLKFVGYISLAVVLAGSMIYVFAGVNEEAKSKGKETIKMALFGAVVSWSGWFLVNFLIDNI